MGSPGTDLLHRQPRDGFVAQYGTRRIDNSRRICSGRDTSPASQHSACIPSDTTAASRCTGAQVRLSDVGIASIEHVHVCLLSLKWIRETDVALVDLVVFHVPNEFLGANADIVGLIGRLLESFQRAHRAARVDAVVVRDGIAVLVESSGAGSIGCTSWSRVTGDGFHHLSQYMLCSGEGIHRLRPRRLIFTHLSELKHTTICKG
mmetsp:Transcript_31928/g.45968  ORF Transcript_31928/g.45968 Transcript_31928/m.45968 type:complete len:205 (-) Transcript_31928:1445-2059(-)